MSKSKAKVDWKNLAMTMAVGAGFVVIGNYAYANIPRVADKFKSLIKGKTPDTTTPPAVE
jgi:hypothetical protein